MLVSGNKDNFPQLSRVKQMDLLTAGLKTDPSDEEECQQMTHVQFCWAMFVYLNNVLPLAVGRYLRHSAYS